MAKELTKLTSALMTNYSHKSIESNGALMQVSRFDHTSRQQFDNLLQNILPRTGRQGFCFIISTKELIHLHQIDLLQQLTDAIERTEMTINVDCSETNFESLRPADWDLLNAVVAVCREITAELIVSVHASIPIQNETLRTAIAAHNHAYFTETRSRNWKAFLNLGTDAAQIMFSFLPGQDKVMCRHASKSLYLLEVTSRLKKLGISIKLDLTAVPIAIIGQFCRALYHIRLLGKRKWQGRIEIRTLNIMLGTAAPVPLQIHIDESTTIDELELCALMGWVERLRRLPPKILRDNLTSLARYAGYGGDLETIHFLIENGFEPTTVFEDGSTLLLCLAQSGNVVAMRELLDDHDLGLDLETRDKHHAGVLDYAAKGGHPGMLHYLVNERHLPDVYLKRGGALEQAARYGHLDAVRYIFTLDRPQHTSDNSGALLAAASGHHLHVIRYLVSLGVSIQSNNYGGHTVLHCAAQSGNTDAFDQLVVMSGLAPGILTREYFRQGYRAGEHHRSKSPLHMAALVGDINMMHHLITRYGLNPATPDASGNTLLHLVAQSGNVAAFDWLVETHGLDPAATNSDHKTALHIAAQYGKIDLVRHLVTRHHLDVHAQAALSFAVGSGSLETVRYLVDECHARLDATSAPHIAATNGDTAMLALLLNRYKLKLDTHNASGDNILHTTLRSRHPIATMRFLMKNYGKSVLKKMAETANHSGENPLYCAIRGFNQELIRYLVLELGWNLEADSGTYHGTYIQAGKRKRANNPM